MTDPLRRRITYDRFGRAWSVAYSNADGSEYGYLVPTAPGRSRHPHGHPLRTPHRQPAFPAAAPAAQKPRINPYTGEPVDPHDGMSDNMMLQAMFHSRAGQAQWDASYRLVRNATAVYASLAFLAFFTPEVLGGGSFALRWSLNQAGAFGPAVNRLFWSGTGYWVALRYGAQMGGYVGQTLEESPIGGLAGSMQAYLPWNNVSIAVWTWLSQGFAEGAEGDAIFFEGWLNDAPYAGKMWELVERLTLMERGIPIDKVPGKPF